MDARRAGASYREVAAVYFGARRVSAEPWKTSSLKAQIVRLAAYGQSMIDRGYRDLLAGKGLGHLGRPDRFGDLKAAQGK